MEPTNVLYQKHYAINTFIFDNICIFCHDKVHIYSLMKLQAMVKCISLMSEMWLNACTVLVAVLCSFVCSV